ncbi:MAG TPA: MarR family winged helix-turn-helix transcriptional regulator [Solirubrobacteraceae bacterium]|nr:MarR family winged helix-turn-helix transcriptional regulator [Solirubrobacteraceae bacterium]
MTTRRSPPASADAIAAVRALARALRVLERATDELSLAHYRVLVAVASGDERASRVAAKLALGKPAVSAAVEALARRGLLARSSVAGDQRAAALSVTPGGAAVLARVERAMSERLHELCAHAPDPERLLAALAELGPAVDERRAEREAARSPETGAA